VGRLAGVEATDWSWGALMFDMDNDGLRDIFVANGIYQDLTNQDFLAVCIEQRRGCKIGCFCEYKEWIIRKLVELIPVKCGFQLCFSESGEFRTLS
jgi:hypothetical protein